MGILTIFAVPAISLQIKLTNFPISIVFQKVVNNVVIILQAVRKAIIDLGINLNDSAILLNDGLNSRLTVQLALELARQLVD